MIREEHLQDWRDAALRVAERVTPFKRAIAAQLAGRP
mgnify:CR=1 FL=1